MVDVKKMICLYVTTGFVYERDYCDCVISDVLSVAAVRLAANWLAELAAFAGSGL